MKSHRWHRNWLAATAAAGLAVGGVWADPPAVPQTVILLREPGKPDRKCVIERTTPQADGTLLHEVRDAATGEKFRVTDSRRHTGLLGPVIARKPNTTEPPLANPAPPRRLPTTAELAGYASPTVPPGENGPQLNGILRRTKPAVAGSPVQVQVQKLKDAVDPTEREMAAMTLTLSDARNSLEVIDALVTAAKATRLRACVCAWCDACTGWPQSRRRWCRRFTAVRTPPTIYRTANWRCNSWGRIMTVTAQVVFKA